MTAQEFRKIRRKLGLTQPELSNRLGMGINLVNSIERSDDAVPLRYEYAIRWLLHVERQTENA